MGKFYSVLFFLTLVSNVFVLDETASRLRWFALVLCVEDGGWLEKHRSASSLDFADVKNGIRLR